MDPVRPIDYYLKDRKRVAITGHVSPDGDCLGSCLGLYNYIKDNYPQITADVYLQEARSTFDYMPGIELVRHEDMGEDYDMLVLLDISSKERIAFCTALLERTKTTLCLDHHFTNPGGFTWFYNDPEASSASEVLYRHLDPEKISKNCATCLYTGIIHDTGVFQYPATSPETMRIAGELMGKGVDFSTIIDEGFFQKTFLQNRALGDILSNAKLYLDDQVIIGSITRKRRHELGVEAKDLDSVVPQLRNTSEVDTAVFLYQLDDGAYKASFRSRRLVDVSAVSAKFGGGGHIRAAGCRFEGALDDIIETVLSALKEQLYK